MYNSWYISKLDVYNLFIEHYYENELKRIQTEKQFKDILKNQFEITSSDVDNKKLSENR